jgi:hypothetical protein
MRLGLGYAAMLAVALSASAAVAQQKSAPSNQQLAQTPGSQPPAGPVNRDDPYAAQGIPLGGFVLLPELKIGETYDDNIFRDSANTKSDFITTVRPEAALRSNWNNHMLNFFAAVESGFYADHSDENYNDVFVGTDGRVDIQRDTNVTAGLNHTWGHEERGSPDDVNGTEPADTQITNARLGLAHTFNRLKVSPYGLWSRYDYTDVKTSAGATINNDDRDNDVMKGGLRLDYDVHTSFDVFVEGIYNTVNYSDARDDNGFNRDSNGWEGRTGVVLGLTNLITGEAYVGYMSQSMDDARFSDIDGVSFGGGIKWEVTRLTTVGFNAARTIQQTTTTGSSGIIQTGGEATVRHELLRNLILDGGLKYTTNEYEGLAREDDVYEATIGGLYKLNRYVGLGARYRYIERDSDINTSDYTANVATINLVLTY